MNNETVEKAIGRDDPASYGVGKINNKMRHSVIDNDDSFTRLKLKINNILWEELPGHICLTRAEEIACEIMSILIDEMPGESSDL